MIKTTNQNDINLKNSQNSDQLTSFQSTPISSLYSSFNLSFNTMHHSALEPTTPIDTILNTPRTVTFTRNNTIFFPAPETDDNIAGRIMRHFSGCLQNRFLKIGCVRARVCVCVA